MSHLKIGHSNDYFNNDEGDDQTSRITKLDSNSISLIRSGTKIPSIKDLIINLIKISICLGSDSVSISLDLQSGLICVDDNGIGIPKELLNFIGRFETQTLPRNNDSHSEDSNHDGDLLSIHQKQILDSLAHVSLLNICSRTSNSNYTHQTLFRDGKVLFSGPAKTSKKHCRGTTITVRDLFYNLPVRRIQNGSNANGLNFQLMRRQWEDLKRSIEIIGIINPNLNMVLRHKPASAPTSSRTFSSSLLNQSNNLDNIYDNHFKISKTGDSILTFKKVFGHKFLKDGILLNSITSKRFKIDGLLSQHNHLNKLSQLIYLNQVFVPKTNEIYKQINNSLSQNPLAHKFFSRFDDQSETFESLTQQGSPSKNSSSSRDNHPVYLLMFESLKSSISPGTTQNFGNTYFFGDEQESLVPRVEQELINLAIHALSTQLERIDMKTSGKSFSKPLRSKQPALSSRSNSSGINWHGENNSEIEKGPTPLSLRKLKRRRGSSDSDPPESPSLSKSVGSKKQKIHGCDSSSRDPQKQSAEKSLEKKSETFGKDEDRRDTKTRNFLDPITLKKSIKFFSKNQFENQREGSEKVPDWIKKGLRDYSSPVFGARSREIFRKFSSSTNNQNNGLQKSKFGKVFTKDPTSFGSNFTDRNKVFKTQIKKLTENFLEDDKDQEKEEVEGFPSFNDDDYKKDLVDLSNLSNNDSFRFIGQLNKEFILVLLDQNLIIAFDQHAVHERIRVERFFKSFFPKRNNNGNDLKLKKVYKKNFFSPEKKFSNNNNNSKDISGGGNNGIVDGFDELNSDGLPILVDRVEYEGFHRWKNSFQKLGFIYELGDKISQKDSIRNFSKPLPTLKTPRAENPEDSQVDDNSADDGFEDENEENELNQIILFTVPDLISSRVEKDFKLLLKVLKSSLSFFEDKSQNDHLNFFGDYSYQTSNNQNGNGKKDNDSGGNCSNGKKKGENLDASCNEKDKKEEVKDKEEECFWYGELKRCPKIFIDLINSKACRGSIMFGDELKESDCKKLLKELSLTKFPFKCAHGRPTCQPLIKVDINFPSTSDYGTEKGLVLILDNDKGQKNGRRKFSNSCSPQRIQKSILLNRPINWEKLFSEN